MTDTPHLRFAREAKALGGEPYLLDNSCVAARNESGRVFVCHGDPSPMPRPYDAAMEAKQDHQCIEFRFRHTGSATYFSVDRYANRIDFAKFLRGDRAISFHEVRWTIGAPRVEELTTDWQKTKEGRFRICDRETYDSQMRQMIGLEERSEDWAIRSGS